MSGDGVGLVLNVEPRGQSRSRLTTTADDFGQTDVTLMAGVLGTEDGFEVIQQASRRRTLVYSQARPKPRRTPEV